MADITVTPANVVSVAGTIAHGTAGETITAGMTLYLKSSDSRLWKAQADGTSAEADCVGISLHGATAGQPLSYQTDGTMNIGGTTAKTEIYVVSAAAGGVGIQSELVSTNKISFVAYATATDGSITLLRKSTGVAV